MYLFDTDHVTILQWRTSPDYEALSERLSQCLADDFFVSIVSFHEEVRGWNRYINRAKTSADVVKAYEKFAKILANFSAMQVLSFDADAAAAFEEIKKQKIRIGTMDLRIAAIALVKDFTVLTRNFADFEKVPRLKFEDWTVPLKSQDS